MTKTARPDGCDVAHIATVPMDRLITRTVGNPSVSMGESVPIGMGSFVDWLLETLREGFQPSHPVKRKFLLEQARARFTWERLTDEHLRLAKEELIERGEPICSGPSGWWYGRSQEEIHEAACYLEERGRDLMRKASLLRKAGDRLYGKQVEMALRTQQL